LHRATVTEVNRNIAATLKLCGPAILSPSATSGQSTPLEQATALVLLLLQKQHPCQKDEDDFDDAEPLDEESAEYDWLVIETALEVIGSLASVLGEQFGELWQIFETPILKYASSQERFERSSAVGTIADCVESMGAASTPYTQKLMRVFVKRLTDEDPETKSNAAFGTGLLCEKSTDGKEVLSNYSTILGKLEPLLDASTSEGHARLLDNAAGCVSRMIKKSPQNVPLEDVLPRLLDILPLKEDFDENEPVYDMFVALLQQQNKVVQGLSGKLVPIFEKVLSPPEEQLSEGMREKVQQMVGYLRR
jgi:importin-4